MLGYLAFSGLLLTRYSDLLQKEFIEFSPLIDFFNLWYMCVCF